MCAKALEAGWGGIYYKTIGIFIPDECSPRLDVYKRQTFDYANQQKNP